MLLFSNYYGDGSRTSFSTGLQFDEYVWERVTGSGVAEVVDTSGQQWTVELR